MPCYRRSGSQCSAFGKHRAAFNAGWSVYLSWQGVRRLVLSVPETAKPEEIVAGLQAILQRFMPDDRDRPEVIS